MALCLLITAMLSFRCVLAVQNAFKDIPLNTWHTSYLWCFALVNPIIHQCICVIIDDINLSPWFMKHGAVSIGNERVFSNLPLKIICYFSTPVASCFFCSSFYKSSSVYLVRKIRLFIRLCIIVFICVCAMLDYSQLQCGSECTCCFACFPRPHLLHILQFLASHFSLCPLWFCFPSLSLLPLLVLWSSDPKPNVSPSPQLLLKMTE